MIENKYLFFIILLFCMSKHLSASDKYLLFYTEDKQISGPRANFYAEIDRFIHYRINIIKSKNDKRNLIDRATFTKSHPYAHFDKDLTKIEPGKNTSLIAKVQKKLEENAVGHAIIVDCKVNNSGLLQACGLYNYSRAKEKVVSSSKRVFSVPIAKGSSWAYSIIENYHNGIETLRERKNQKLINSLANKKLDLDPLVESELGVLGVVGRSSASNTVPGFTLLLGLGTKKIKGLLNFNYFINNSKINNSWKDTEDYQIEIGCNMNSDKINNIFWGLGFFAGYDLNYTEWENNQYKNSNIYISVKPNLKISISSKSYVMLIGNYSWFGRIKHEDSLDLAMNQIVDKYLSLGYVRNL